jgi:hypothetical protein
MEDPASGLLYDADARVYCSPTGGWLYAPETDLFLDLQTGQLSSAAAATTATAGFDTTTGGAGYPFTARQSSFLRDTLRYIRSYGLHVTQGAYTPTYRYYTDGVGVYRVQVR